MDHEEAHVRNEITVRNRHKTREPARFFGSDFLLVRKKNDPLTEADRGGLNRAQGNVLNQRKDPTEVQVTEEEQETLDQERLANRMLAAAERRAENRLRERNRQGERERRQQEHIQADIQRLRIGIHNTPLPHICQLRR